MRNGVFVELGGGLNPHPRSSIVIDLHHPKGIPAQDALDIPWPIESNSVEEVYASHFLEHIPKGQSVIELFNEVWRILQPGGMFTFILPVVGYTDRNGIGHTTSSWHPYADPTHVSYWWFPESLYYFTKQYINPGADYGINKWNDTFYIPENAINLNDTTSFWSVRYNWEGIARLIKPDNH